jgi:hypothetical protein
MLWLPCIKCLTFTDMPQAVRIFASRLHGTGVLGRWCCNTTATTLEHDARSHYKVDVSTQVPVDHLANNCNHPFGRTIFANIPPDILEDRQRRHARDSDKIRALDMDMHKKGEDTSHQQLRVMAFGLIITPLPGRLGHDSGGNHRQRLPWLTASTSGSPRSTASWTRNTLECVCRLSL